MAFYDFYRQNLPMGGGPGMGGDILAPPQPFYQPQPNWGGLDYYRAQAQAADSSLYEYGLDRIRGLNFSQGITGIGVGAGIEEAKILHQRAYFGEVKVMMPADIGAAAAYEAWRNWSAYQGTYMQPLSADRDRQREALIGMAIGEAARLWNYTANPMDIQSRLVAVEGAAATAAKIFVQSAAGGMAGGGLGMGMGGSPLMGAGAGMGMGGSPLMGAGAGLGVGAGGLSPGIGVGPMGAGDYLGVPQRPMMRRRSLSDLAMMGGAGYGGGMGTMGAGMGYGAGMGGGMGYGDGLGGGMGYGAGYGGGMPYGAGGMGYGGMGGGAGYGGAGMLGGGAGYGMGGAGLGVGGLAAAHPLASSAGMLAGELEGRHRRRRSRSRHRRRRRSIDGGLLGAELGQGMYGGYGGYGGGAYGGGYGGGYGGYGGGLGYGHHRGALAAGLAAGAQGYAASR